MTIVEVIREKHPKLFAYLRKGYRALHHEISNLSPYLCYGGFRLKHIQEVVEKKMFQKTCNGEFKMIPIYILSYNRLSYLKQIIDCLELYGYINIHIIDNASTYPPLLEYYKSLPYTIIYMERNYGHMVFFKHRMFRKIRLTSFYVYTDPDVLPIADCPDDFMEIFYNALMRYPIKNKVGFSLKLDDIPDKYTYRHNVIDWESQLYNAIIQEGEPRFYDAAIDTTFALYRPKIYWSFWDFYAAIRVGFPYQARHLPWYKSFEELSEEDIYYNNSKLSSTGNWNYDVDSDTLRKRYGGL